VIDTVRVRGCCPLDCQDSCSWVAHVHNGVVRRVEGARDHPITRGTLCAKVNEHGPAALFSFDYLGSMGVVQRRALRRIFHALGASRQTGSVCGAAGNVLEAEGEVGAARPAAVRAGIAPQQTVTGEQFVRSLSALAVLGGHWQLPGGGLFIETNPAMNEAPAGRRDVGPTPRLLDIARLGAYLTDPALDPPVRGLMVWGANPAVSQPSAGLVRKGLARDDLFLLVVEHFLTDTARYADVVLPSTTQLEHFDVQGAWGHHCISVNVPAVAPLGEARSHGEIMRMLARRLGLTGPAFRESDEQIAAGALPHDLTLDELKARGFVKRSPRPPVFGPGGSVVRLSEPATRPVSTGPLQLLTPKAHQFLNSTFVNMPRQRKAEGRPTLFMHPADAESRTLAGGIEVRVQNENGSLTAIVEITEGIRQGPVALPGKWWDADSANLLTPLSQSPGGQPAYNDTFVEVSPVATPAAAV